jgi:hypothetical protein
MNASTTTIPILEGNEQELVVLRRRLESMFISLHLIHDITVVCGGACDAVNSDTDAEVSHVLRRCATDEFHAQMKALTDIIECLGDRTEFSEERDPSETVEVFDEEP